MRCVVLGGEEVFLQDVELFREFFTSNCILVNLYGSTESTISAQYLIDKRTNVNRNQISLGYPVDHTEIFLMNDEGEETEIYGEIAIKSPYLTPGYWQLPEKTASVFPVDTSTPTTRIYRTGDMGRLAEGGIEFAGRKDFQVKIRGYRIELEEVEAVLKRYSLVEEAAVLAQIDAEGQKSLVAYVVVNDCVDVRKLREFLKQSLPDYMIPSAFLIIDRLPRTTTGKVDRSVPLPARSEVEASKVPRGTDPAQEL